MKFASTALVVIATLTSGFGALGEATAHAGDSRSATTHSAAVSPGGTTEWGVVKPTA
ncbi:hypothetical protein [Streptomyces sp. NPDC001851]|uniref:hypothetical protein n=1 Tax=Streptomyces sp. NPDC001851 TaxID=3154529 RepID=UPI00331BDE10